MKKIVYTKPEMDILRTDSGDEFELCGNISDDSGDGTDLAKKRKEEEEELEEEEEFAEMMATSEQQSLW